MSKTISCPLPGAQRPNSGSEVNVPTFAVSKQVGTTIGWYGTAAPPSGNGGQRRVRNRTDGLARGQETARYAAQGARHAEAAAAR
jgi:hypothetical protein